MSKANNASVPGSEEREIWAKSGRSSKEVSSAVPSAGCYCFGVHEVSCLPLWVNSTDAELTGQLVEMELEKRRLIDGWPWPSA